jgi:hypothetical protein
MNRPTASETFALVRDTWNELNVANVKLEWVTRMAAALELLRLTIDQTVPPVVDGEIVIGKPMLKDLAARYDMVLVPRAVLAGAESFLSGFEDDTGSGDNKGVPETLAGLRTAMGLQRVPRGWDKVEGGTDA